MISVLLPTKARSDLFPQAYGSLLVQMRDCPEEWEVICVNDNLYSDPQFHIMDDMFKKLGINYICGRGEGCGWAFQYAANAAQGDKLLFINDDVFFYQPFIRDLLFYYEEYGHKIVGSKLLYEDMTIQHAGMAFFADKNWMADHLFRGYPSDYPPANEPRCMPCVTFSLTLVDHKLFDDLGGFDKGYNGNYEDTDFALRALESGASIFYAPESSAIHYESATRGFVMEDAVRTFSKFRGKWVLNNRLKKLLDKNGFLDGSKIKSSGI